MFDIEFSIPISSRPPYFQRFLDLKKYGICNIENRRVLVCLLAGNEEFKREDLYYGWPQHVKAIVHTCHSTQPAPKAYNYYLDLKEEEMQRSRWYAKFDDDSCNDVDGLVASLDRDFDCEKEHYVITEYRKETQGFEDRALHETGYGRWFLPFGKKYTHELEGAVLSQKALYRIFTDENAKKFLRCRLTEERGWSDVALGCAARIAKVFPAEGDCLSCRPSISGFSLFGTGGLLNHIHLLSHDRNAHAFNCVKRAVDNKCYENDWIWESIENNEYCSIINNSMITNIRFNQNGTITHTFHDHNHWFWHETENTIYLCDAEGQDVSRFSVRKHCPKKIAGTFLPKNESHFLISIDTLNKKHVKI